MVGVCGGSALLARCYAHAGAVCRACERCSLGATCDALGGRLAVSAQLTPRAFLHGHVQDPARRSRHPSASGVSSGVCGLLQSYMHAVLCSCYTLCRA